jgi:hypothetical protein
LTISMVTSGIIKGNNLLQGGFWYVSGLLATALPLKDRN